MPHYHHGADRGRVALGDPAAFPRRVKGLEELRDDFGRERLVFRRPAVLFDVECALTRHNPAHVASAVLAQPEWLLVARRFVRGCRGFSARALAGPAQGSSNQAHRVHDSPTLSRRQVLQHDGHLVSCQLLQRPERGSSASGEGQMRLTRIGLRRRTGNQLAS